MWVLNTGLDRLNLLSSYLENYIACGHCLSLITHQRFQVHLVLTQSYEKVRLALLKTIYLKVRLVRLSALPKMTWFIVEAGLG